MFFSDHQVITHSMLELVAKRHLCSSMHVHSYLPFFNHRLPGFKQNSFFFILGENLFMNSFNKDILKFS